MGMGKGSSTQTVELTPEQKETLQIQNKALKETFLPAYQQTVGTAKELTTNLWDPVSQIVQQSTGLARDVAKSGVETGAAAVGQGMSTLQSLFDPNYEKGQVQAALQAGREATREQLGQQNAMYGAAGGLGSSRQALADRNLQQLGEQRQAAAAAGAQAQVQANRSAAAQAVMGAGQNLIGTGLGAAGQAITSSQAPMDLYSKYASIVYGVPQGSTTPNYAGTQGQRSSSKGFGI